MSGINRPKLRKPNETIMAVPRVRTMFDKNGINKEVTTKIKLLEDEKAPYVEMENAIANGEISLNAAGEPQKDQNGKAIRTPLTKAKATDFSKKIAAFRPRLTEIDGDIAANRSAKIRVGGTVSAHLAAFADYMNEELFKFAFDNCIKADGKMVKPEHLKEFEGAEKLQTYPLFSATEAWKNPPSDEEYKDTAKGPTEFYLETHHKELIAPFCVDEKGEVVMEQKEKKKKDANGIETTMLVWSAKRDKDGVYGKLRVSSKLVKFMDMINTQMIELIAAQMVLNRQPNRQGVSEDNLFRCLRAVLDFDKKLVKDIQYGKHKVVDPKAKEENDALPKESRKKESELPKVDAPCITIKYSHRDSRFEPILKFMKTKSK